MTFCCGASMIGTIGHIRAEGIKIYEIPILYCPVCHSIRVHPRVEDEYEILMEYARGDRVREVTFTDFVDLAKIEELEECCTSWDAGDVEAVLREQIDMALDLLQLAKSMADHHWEEQLTRRLKVLSQNLYRWRKNKSLHA